MKWNTIIDKGKKSGFLLSNILYCRLGHEHMNEQLPVWYPLPKWTRARTKKPGGRSLYCCGLELLNAALKSTIQHISFPWLFFWTTPLFLHREDHRYTVSISAAHWIKRKIINVITRWSLYHSFNFRFDYLSLRFCSALPSMVVLPV